jgi:hypothetical protein
VAYTELGSGTNLCLQRVREQYICPVSMSQHRERSVVRFVVLPPWCRLFVSSSPHLGYASSISGCGTIVATTGSFKGTASITGCEYRGGWLDYGLSVLTGEQAASALAPEP